MQIAKIILSVQKYSRYGTWVIAATEALNIFSGTTDQNSIFYLAEMVIV